MRRERKQSVRVVLGIAILLPVMLLLSGCPPDPTLVSTKWQTASISLSGPAKINVGSPPNSINYTVSVKVQRTDPGVVNMVVLLYREPDGPYAGDALLSWTKVMIPANTDSATATLNLGCPGNSVVGTAVTEPDGSPNSEGLPPGPDSHEGGTDVFGKPLAAKIHAYATPLNSNTLFVNCIKQ